MKPHKAQHSVSFRPTMSRDPVISRILSARGLSDLTDPTIVPYSLGIRLGPYYIRSIFYFMVVVACMYIGYTLGKEETHRESLARGRSHSLISTH